MAFKMRGWSPFKQQDKKIPIEEHVKAREDAWNKAKESHLNVETKIVKN